MPRKDQSCSEYGTLREVARRFGIGLKTVRREARWGSFPVYSVGTGWPRAKFSEFEAWLRTTRIRPTGHAEKRVAEVVAREREEASLPAETRRAALSLGKERRRERE